MQTKHIKSMNLASLLISALAGLAVGLLLLLGADQLFNLLAFLLGVVGLVVSLPPFLDAVIRNGEKDSAGGILMYGAAVILSLALMLSRNFVVMIVVGLCLIVIPVVRISMADDSSAQLKKELPRILIGLVLVVVGPCRVIDWLFRAMGVLVLLLTAIYFVYGLLSYLGKIGKAESVTKGTRTFVDTTGDGKVDTIRVDTTGDGKTDTEMPYRRRGEK